jgi:hypothetical protein
MSLIHVKDLLESETCKFATRARCFVAAESFVELDAVVHRANSCAGRFPFILTGYGDKASREQIAAYSRCELLRKPISGEELMRLMALESDSL